MIKRYDMVTEFNKYACEYEATPVESGLGDYVLFEDHETALAIAESDFKVLQSDYQKLVDKIGELYREA